MGIQGSGKSTFARDHFFSTHLRINLDMLKTRHRERRLFETCLEVDQSMVIDNTNPTRADRAKYIVPAKQAGFQVAGYYLRSRVGECQARNESRSGPLQVPKLALLGTAARFELPNRAEGFDSLFYVFINQVGKFVIEDWNDEVCPT